jgi:spoIIIJ-associated protein
MTDSAAAQQWLGEVLELAGFPAHIDHSQPNAQQHWLTIDSADLSDGQVTTLLGTDGTTLDGLQYLAKAAFGEEIVIELNGYRQQRASALKIIADRAAEHVRSTGTEYEMPPLSGAQRREMHTFIENEADYKDLCTTSRGLDADRRLVVELRSS